LFSLRKQIIMNFVISNEQEISQDNYLLVNRFMESVGKEGWFDMLHSDIIMHFPNAPMMGGQEILVGKDEVVAYLQNALAQTDHLRFYNIETWRTQDPNIFFTEYHATVRTGIGKHFQYVYVNQVMIKDGKINFVREYWDPRRRMADSMNFVFVR